MTEKEVYLKVVIQLQRLKVLKFAQIPEFNTWVSSHGAEYIGAAGPPQASVQKWGQEASAGRWEQVGNLVQILGQLPTGFSISYTSATI